MEAYRQDFEDAADQGLYTKTRLSFNAWGFYPIERNVARPNIVEYDKLVKPGQSLHVAPTHLGTMGRRRRDLSLDM